ncbi:MAG: hypothetical protein IJF07_01135 [Lachnospiraceae bacterium]|nr:hypothetical protein [Lachnospiraceae bacterium]
MKGLEQHLMKDNETKLTQADSASNNHIPDIEIIDLEDNGSPDKDTTFDKGSFSRKTANNELQEVPSKTGFQKFLNIHVLFFLVVIILLILIVSRLSNWGVRVDQEDIFKDGLGTYEDNFDEVLPLMDENGMPIFTDEVSTIVAFGNAPFADDRDSEDNLANMIAELTGATVYNCSVSGSYLAAQDSFYDSDDDPMDAFCFYWLATLATGGPIDFFYPNAEKEMGANYPAEADEVVNTLTTLDFNTVDVITIMYDATDYLMGNPMYSDENETDTTQFTGNLEAGIELLQATYPHIRIIVMSPTYAYAVDTEGNYVSSDMYTYGEQDVLSTYVIKEYASCLSRSVSFVDHLYGTITEANASEYLTDNLHLNVEGRRLVAERFEYFLNYYSKGYADTE